MTDIRWDKRPEDMTHVNPHTMRSHKVIDGKNYVWINDQWAVSSVPVDRLVAKPNTTEEKEPMSIKTIKVESPEQLIKELQAMGMSKAEIDEIVSDIASRISELDEGECHCETCQRKAALEKELNEITSQIAEIAGEVKARKLDPITAITKTSGLAARAQEVMNELKELNADEDGDEEGFNQPMDRLADISMQVVDFLKANMGQELTTPQHMGMVTAATMVVAALDSLDLLAK